MCYFHPLQFCLYTILESISTQFYPFSVWGLVEGMFVQMRALEMFGTFMSLLFMEGAWKCHLDTWLCPRIILTHHMCGLVEVMWVQMMAMKLFGSVISLLFMIGVWKCHLDTWFCTRIILTYHMWGLVVGVKKALPCNKKAILTPCVKTQGVRIAMLLHTDASWAIFTLGENNSVCSATALITPWKSTPGWE